MFRQRGTPILCIWPPEAYHGLVPIDGMHIADNLIGNLALQVATIVSKKHRHLSTSDMTYLLSEGLSMSQCINETWLYYHKKYVQYLPAVKGVMLQSAHPSFIVHMMCDFYLLGEIMSAIKRNEIFYDSFLSYASFRVLDMHNLADNMSKVRSFKENISMVILSLKDCKAIMDYLGCWRIESLVQRKVILDDTMNWLNTLGGGFSSLGDASVAFAKEAGDISTTQLKVAMEMGDLAIQCRCRIYVAQSLMQRGYLKRAKDIIRREYDLVKTNKLLQDKLPNICKGVWGRLQYLHQLKRKETESRGS